MGDAEPPPVPPSPDLLGGTTLPGTEGMRSPKEETVATDTATRKPRAKKRPSTEMPFAYSQYELRSTLKSILAAIDQAEGRSSDSKPSPPLPPPLQPPSSSKTAPTAHPAAIHDPHTPPVRRRGRPRKVSTVLVVPTEPRPSPAVSDGAALDAKPPSPQPSATVLPSARKKKAARRVAVAIRTSRGSTPIGPQPYWYTQVLVVLRVLRCFDGPSRRGPICRRALELDAVMARQLRCNKVFGGLTPQNSASSVLTKLIPEHVICTQGADEKRFYELCFRFDDAEDARRRYEHWKVCLWEQHWPRKWRTWTATSDGRRRRPTEAPRTEADLVQVRRSNIVSAGRGAFALVDIPADTVLGFYFGVPCFEDEYDRDKDRVGHASRYSIRYKSLVLDATDAKGRPFVNPVYCPFHMLNDYQDYNVVLVDGPIAAQIQVKSVRDIEAGEELYAHYGNQIDREGWRYDLRLPTNGD
eukprot:TRINITY_DN3332_c0_g1_i1.p1 TRINITY_DN3332_c0_g1~~TRINITY_DN3332_c0_g1_i1.p1  ORF type:complete len:469 (+),score=82.06 TRINITY_DN3332_c0_g1_i1:1426-2832(+)